MKIILLFALPVIHFSPSSHRPKIILEIKMYLITQLIFKSSLFCSSPSALYSKPRCFLSSIKKKYLIEKFSYTRVSSQLTFCVHWFLIDYSRGWSHNSIHWYSQYSLDSMWLEHPEECHKILFNHTDLIGLFGIIFIYHGRPTLKVYGNFPMI